MDRIGLVILVSLIKLASPATISLPSTVSTPPPATSTPAKNVDLQFSRYQVTENVVDIPDDRTLPPVISNFTLVLPLNYGNNSAVNTNKESVEEDSGESNLKKNSFSILHIKGEYDQPAHVDHKHVIIKFLGGLRDYVYNLKRGIVDGLHTFLHKHDGTPGNDDEEFHDKFHRNFHGLKDVEYEHDYHGHDHHDDESTEYFGDY